MQIYVNDEKIDYKPMFPLTWGNLLQKLLQGENFIPKDHGVVRIVVDGEESLQVMTDETDKIVAEDIKILQIFTKDSLSITRDGFDKVLNLIESIKIEISSAADLYREGEVKEASSKIVKIMEAFKPMVNFIQSVGISFGLNFDEVRFDANTSLREKIETFLKTFSDLVVAQQKKDYVEIADYLEYQLLEDMEDWAKIVTILLREVEASTSQM